MSGSKVIHFLSASDRLNYGDLLFPILFKKFLEVNQINVCFHNYGIVVSDFSSFKALKTKSFRDLEKNVRENDIIVVGGGEVLFANWTTIYAFINPFFKSIIKNNFFKKLVENKQIAKRLLSKRNITFPFAFDGIDFDKEKLYIRYSSVGGGDLLGSSKRLGKVAYEKMKFADLISLRDERSVGLFKKFTDLDVSLVPDSALIMSKYFPISILTDLMSFDFEFSQKYIFVQVGLKKGPVDLVSFVNKLEDISKQNNLKIVLSPIGLALGHEDDIILKKLKKLNSDFIYIQPKNVFDTMSLIANASLYMGTSLHGAITAMSYLVPAIGLNKRIVKLESYLQTWVHESITNIDFVSVTNESVLKRKELFELNYNKDKLCSQINSIEMNLKLIVGE